MSTTTVNRQHHTKHRVPFEGVIAHHAGPEVSHDHGAAFRTATVEAGQDASRYFEEAGIAALAEGAGGLCTFWLNGELALYQSTNRPLVCDTDLAPSISTNAELFGTFMGALATDNPARIAKRAVVEQVLGSAQVVTKLQAPIIQHVQQFLATVTCHEQALDEFVLQLTAHVDSLIPGVLDLRDKPLTDYLNSTTYGHTARNFFETASEVISKLTPEAIKDADLIVDFTRDLLNQNYTSLASAPPTNMIRRQFIQYQRDFNRDAIATLTAAELKELGTMIIATYDTTALSLLWAIAYIETTPSERARLLSAIADNSDPFEVATLLVLEAIRLGGSNPTALWRKTVKSVSIEHNGKKLDLPTGTMIWLDRRKANRDSATFAQPEQFNACNIAKVIDQDGKTSASLMARNRYEINSFSMVNTVRNPRKCPGRLFSVNMQAIVLLELYRDYDIAISGVDLRLAPHCAMPRPSNPGSIRIDRKTHSNNSIET